MSACMAMFIVRARFSYSNLKLSQMYKIFFSNKLKTTFGFIIIIIIDYLYLSDVPNHCLTVCRILWKTFNLNVDKLFSV